MVDGSVLSNIVNTNARIIRIVEKGVAMIIQDSGRSFVYKFINCINFSIEFAKNRIKMDILITDILKAES